MKTREQKKRTPQKNQAADCRHPLSEARPLPSSPRSCLGRRHGVGVEHGGQQVLDDLVLALLAGRLDLLDLDLGLAAGLLLGRLVSLGVLGLLVGPIDNIGWAVVAYLRFKLLELGLLLGLVLVNLFPGLVAGLSYALRPDCRRGLVGVNWGCLWRVVVGYIHSRAVIRQC